MKFLKKMYQEYEYLLVKSAKALRTLRWALAPGPPWPNTGCVTVISWVSRAGRMVFGSVLAAQMVMSSSSKPPSMLGTRLQVCGLKRLGRHADLYTVSRCCTRGESEDHTGEKTCKGIHLGFDTQGRNRVSENILNYYVVAGRQIRAK